MPACCAHCQEEPMRTVEDALREADPLGEEPNLLEAERERLRQVVMARAASVKPRGGLRGLPFSAMAAVVAVVMLAPLIGMLWFWSGAADLQAAVRFEVRLAEEQPGPGLRDARIAGTDRVVYLHPQPIASNGDILESAVVEGDRPGRWHVVVTFSGAAAERMQRVSAGHIGRPMAILIDGNVVAAPTVRSPIGESALISGGYTRAEAERIATGIRLR